MPSTSTTRSSVSITQSLLYSLHNHKHRKSRHSSFSSSKRQLRTERYLEQDDVAVQGAVGGEEIGTRLTRQRLRVHCQLFFWNAHQSEQRPRDPKDVERWNRVSSGTSFGIGRRAGGLFNCRVVNCTAGWFIRVTGG